MAALCRAGADPSRRIRGRGLAGVTVGHPSRLCDGALAGVLMGGARVWPGIWLGSFVVNLGTAFDATHSAALLTSIAIPTSIGVGATMQALVGASLVRCFVGF